jgi:hypothetical protein
MARLAGNGSALGGLFTNLAGGIGKFRTGVMSDLSALKSGFMVLWGVVAAHPFVAIGTAIAAAAALIYIYWEPVKEFFDNLWKKINDVNSFPQATLPSAEVQAAGPAAIHEHFVQNWGTPGVNAFGGFISRPTLSWVGDDGPEYIIPVGSAYRERGRSLLGQAASALGLSFADRSPFRLGSLFSDSTSESEESPFANWAEKLRDFISPQPQMAMAGASGGFNCSITINAAPGMDERALADEVIRRIEELEARRRRGAYGDDAFFG